MSSSRSFVRQEQIAQATYFKAHHPEQAGHKGKDYRLATRELNLAPAIRGQAEDYFKAHKIVWHRHANHGLSSQVCCLNFLMPLAERPAMLARLVGKALGTAPPEMLPVETGPHGRLWYVGFEWIGREDYLGEHGSKAPTRGANVTSADAVVRFRLQGRLQTLLIEWKYTEAYGGALSGGERSAETRTARYRDGLTAPNGPLKANLDLPLTAFFYEPFYQLLRQQMLAWRMQVAQEDGAERVQVLHISSAANTALHAVTSPTLRERFGATDAFKVFRDLLDQPHDLIEARTETLFAPLLHDTDAGTWGEYLRERYTFVTSTIPPAETL